MSDTMPPNTDGAPEFPGVQYLVEPRRLPGISGAMSYPPINEAPNCVITNLSASSIADDELLELVIKNRPRTTNSFYIGEKKGLRQSEGRAWETKNFGWVFQPLGSRQSLDSIFCVKKENVKFFD